MEKGFSKRTGESPPEREKYESCDAAQQILSLDNINTCSACQSQGFLLCTCFIFLFNKLFSKNPQGSNFSFPSYPLRLSKTLGFAVAGRKMEFHPLFYPDAPCGAYFKMHHWPVSFVAVVLYG